MMNMIRNKVPGLYMFHYGEERGCIGSKAAAKDYKDILRTYKAAIAFDRKGYTDIVRYQNGARCCSDAFAASLAKALDRNYSASSGVYTDTAEYTDVIGECTNISVGYFAQHTANEYQDVDFALWLARRMCEADFSKLACERKAGTYEGEYASYGYGSYRGGCRYGTYYKPTTIYGLVRENPWEVAKILEKVGVSFEDLQKQIEEEDNLSYIRDAYAHVL